MKFSIIGFVMIGVGFLLFIPSIAEVVRYAGFYQEYENCLNDINCQGFRCDGTFGVSLDKCPPYPNDITMWWKVGFGGPLIVIGVIVIVERGYEPKPKPNNQPSASYGAPFKL